jgi:hypothetical protein
VPFPIGALKKMHHTFVKLNPRANSLRLTSIPKIFKPIEQSPEEIIAFDFKHLV